MEEVLLDIVASCTTGRGPSFGVEQSPVVHNIFGLWIPLARAVPSSPGLEEIPKPKILATAAPAGERPESLESGKPHPPAPTLPHPGALEPQGGGGSGL